MEKKIRPHTDIFSALDDLRKLFKLVVDVVLAEQVCIPRQGTRGTLNKDLLN